MFVPTPPLGTDHLLLQYSWFTRKPGDFSPSVRNPLALPHNAAYLSCAAFYFKKLLFPDSVLANVDEEDINAAWLYLAPGH